MNRDRGPRLLTALGFLAATLLTMTAFMHVFAPAESPPPAPPVEAYDRAAMRAALAPDAVAADVARIRATGSRFIGQPGFHATAELLEAEFAAAGLELYPLDLATLAPVTTRREIRSAAGAPLPGIALYPFFPNHLQPMNTPPGGVTGELVLMTAETLLTRERFDDCIAVLDAADPPLRYGLDWTRFAQLGVQAVIVAHRDGLAALTASQWQSAAGGLVGHDPINFVRLAADGDIFAHLGQTVTLDVRTEYRPTPHRTLVGVLRADRPNTEALVITAAYDAYSLLPDLAPGGLQAYGPATQLALLRGLLSHRADLRRDVIFVADGSRSMAHAGATHLLSLIGPGQAREQARALARVQHAENTTQQALLAELVAAAQAPGFLAELAPTQAALAAVSPAARTVFDAQFSHVLNTLLFEQTEELLQARLAFIRDDSDNLQSAPYRTYLARKQIYDATFSAAGYSAARLLEARGEFVADQRVAARVRDRLAELAAFHETRARQFEQELALQELFTPYRSLVVVAPELTVGPATDDEPEAVAFLLAPGIEHRDNGPHFNNLLLSALRRLGPAAERVRYQSLTRDHASRIGAPVATVPLGTLYWNRFQYPAITLLHPQRKPSYDQYPWPVDGPHVANAESMRHGLQLLGETTLALAYGNGRFEEPKKVSVNRFHGQVFVGGIGESIVPNYPLTGALVGGKGPDFMHPGHLRYRFLLTDPYGRYGLWGSPADFAIAHAPHAPVAARAGPDGVIAHIKDEGLSAQSIYQSMNLSLYSALTTPVHLVVFRATPVTILDNINPQTMKAYAGIELAKANSLAGFDNIHQCFTGGPMTTFIRPDERFIVKLKAGAPDNELVQTTRAVILNPRAGKDGRPGSATEINAAGYLAVEHPLLLDTPHKTAESMHALNRSRLATLEQHRMADERTVDFQRQAGALLATAAEPAQPKHEAILAARDSATYSILNYPVIRGAIFDAVYGILWYLFLLVPFVFFFEKLAIGFTDIRRQLAANAVIFLVVFALLKLLHPAFEMIRSSLMILLGFVIFLISLGVIVLLSGRFRENLEALKHKRAQVTAAEVNTLGVIGTAFALGLNNMHRRKVRTGLTCATLVLITFAMLCFSTLHSDVVDTALATGRAAYQGILDKPEKFRPISAAEQFALGMKYGHRYPLAPRSMYVGYETWDREALNPDLAIVRAGDAGELRKVNFDSIIELTPAEPLAGQIALLTTNGWFTADELVGVNGALPIMIPEAMAWKLGITAAQVNAAPPLVQVNGKDFVVKGLFDADQFQRLTDLDGRNLLPFDVTAMTTIRSTGGGRFWEVIAEDTDPLLSAENVILAPTVNLGITVPNGFTRLVSIAVAMPDLPYAEARAEISRYLEQTGKATHYGLDGVAYLGKRHRETSFVGLLDLLIPLFIASITVLNTIRGSVYERRDEIFVYNAVGIAPRYVFFMFMAEALVYSVVGTVLGYLLAQGTGSVLTALDLTGGLQMNFTSKITVYVSITIILATLVSTYFPARSALEIAAPAEESGWKLPEPVDDTLGFALPFTFSHHDRIAILAFFHRYFLDHGEGSAGRFFAGAPRLGVSSRADAVATGQPVPEIRATIWLKPYDLGVSQELSIALPTDPETGEYLARINLERLSGTREAWLRLNHSFVSQVRRHFLHWRAVGPEQRAELHGEAGQLLETETQQPAPATANT